jgi:hypothetical protein
MLFRINFLKAAEALDAILLGSIVKLWRANKKVRAKIQLGKPERYSGDDLLQHTTADLHKELMASVAGTSTLQLST